MNLIRAIATIAAIQATSSVGYSAAANAAVNSPDIVGGRLVTASETIARRTVGLYMVKHDGKGGICTGSILHAGAVLTAAHCIHNAKTVVVVFALNQVPKIAQQVLTSQSEGTLQARVATRFRALPGYSGQTGGEDEFSDLAVVAFSGGLPSGYEPAHFLNQAETAKYLKKGTPVTLAGYGITSVEERSASISGPKTSGTLRQVQIAFNSFSPNRVQMLLQGPTNRNACSGDSGGPAMIEAEGNVYVIGVASRSDCIQSSIYTWVPREKAITSARFLAAAF